MVVRVVAELLARFPSDCAAETVAEFVIVPGVVVCILTFGAIPACVAEGLGPIDSIKRSAALTSGYRWQIAAIGLVAAAFNYGVAAAVELASGLVGAQSFISKLLFGSSSALVLWIGIAIQVATYCELRRVKERLGAIGAPLPA